MWGIPLSGPLSIVVLVCRYHTNKLIERILILYRNLYSRSDATLRDYGGLIFISKGYTPVQGRLYTRYAPVRRSSAEASFPVTPRLACVKPAASVHPEPGSNSSLLFLNKINATTSKKINSVKMVLFTCIFRYALSFFNSYTFNELLLCFNRSLSV